MTESEKIKAEANKLFSERTWKSSVILGVVFLVILVLLNSFLFALAIGLLKFVLLVGGFGLIIYGAYLAYREKNK